MTTLFTTTSTPVLVTKLMVKEAYRKVKSNHGSAGVDGESLLQFEANLLPNLYKLWNRMNSGSYFPQPVKEVIIPKANGGKRNLGIPTVTDRIAQEVVKTYLEPRLEAIFSGNSYGFCQYFGRCSRTHYLRNGGFAQTRLGHRFDCLERQHRRRDFRARLRRQSRSSRSAIAGFACRNYRQRHRHLFGNFGC